MDQRPSKPVPGLTLVTLVTVGRTPFDIATSVGKTDGPVYSPEVLRLRSQPSRDGAPLPT